MSRSRTGSLRGRRRRIEFGSRARFASKHHADRRAQRGTDIPTHACAGHFAHAGRVDGTIGETHPVGVADRNTRAEIDGFAERGTHSRTDCDRRADRSARADADADTRVRRHPQRRGPRERPVPHVQRHQPNRDVHGDFVERRRDRIGEIQ
jgi:hypothetical protein